MNLHHTLHSFLSFFTIVITLSLSAQVNASPLPSEEVNKDKVVMRDVFATMPDTVLPLVNKYARLICLDLFENHIKAEARNTLDDFVELEALTSDYLRFRTSVSSLLELKLLPLDSVYCRTTTTDSLASDSLSCYVLCLVTTALAGEPGTPLRLEDSTLRFLHSA